MLRFIRELGRELIHPFLDKQFLSPWSNCFREINPQHINQEAIRF